MTRHFAACPKRQAQIEQASKSKRKAETLHHLRCQASYLVQFWFDVEIRGSARLRDIDHYLREIWLECCGHMSQFSVGGWSGDEINMRHKVDAVFRNGVELTHIYDFGSSSETLIKPIGQRTGVPLTDRPIVLMARNNMPQEMCDECDRPATHLCVECANEGEALGNLCAEHARTHPHDEYDEPIELVNSPRLGVCAYTGPAVPPY